MKSLDEIGSKIINVLLVEFFHDNNEAYYDCDQIAEHIVNRFELSSSDQRQRINFRRRLYMSLKNMEKLNVIESRFVKTAINTNKITYKKCLEKTF